MLVYREQQRPALPASLLADACAQVRHLASSRLEVHDRVVRLLIDLGVLESALADHLCPDAEVPMPAVGALRSASVAAGHLLWHAWRGTWSRADPWLDRARTALGIASEAALPLEIAVKVPEGFAHYGLYPETYLLAAERAARACPSAGVVCLGIRSIGTSLSAVVSAVFEELGREVLSLTVRPHGHPYERRPRLGGQMVELLRHRRSDLFLVVDEGPGISGSSFHGVCRALEELGVPEDRIVLIPSWRTDGRTLRSPEARQGWDARPQFTASFEETWVTSGRLQALAPGYGLQDYSAGGWRPYLLPDPLAYPAVQPQHERRKYRAQPLEGRGEDLLLRFVGLGAYGDSALARARALAERGVGASPRGLRHGFLALHFVAGTRVTPDDTPELVPVMACYLARIRRSLPSAEPATELDAMVTRNVDLALGPEAAGRALKRWRAPRPDCEATALDARMLPHEWIRTPLGFTKVDAVDHHDDHFYPGPQDIAWDVAGTCLEFALDRDARRALVEHYVRASGDRAIATRVPAFAVAYLAFRLGYATLAAEQLRGAPDAARFRAQAAFYRSHLLAELEPGAEARWWS